LSQPERIGRISHLLQHLKPLRFYGLLLLRSLKRRSTLIVDPFDFVSLPFKRNALLVNRLSQWQKEVVVNPKLLIYPVPRAGRSNNYKASQEGGSENVDEIRDRFGLPLWCMI